MSQPLIAPGKLIDASWKTMLAEWRATLLYTILLFIAPLVVMVVGLPLLYVAMRAGTDNILIGLLWLALMVAMVFAVSWPTLKLTRYLLEKDLGRPLPTPEKDVTFALILSYLWIAFLTGLAVILGYIVFIIPGIWLSILLAEGYLLLLEDGIKGTAALRASADLIKGRWWKVLGRLFLVGLFAGGMAIGFSIALSIVGGIITTLLRNDLLSGIILLVINIAAQLVLTVFLTLFSVAACVKLFHSLKESPVQAPSAPPSQPQM